MSENKPRQKTSYSDKLRDPRWQKRRLAILNRDDWACQLCFDKETTLHVHHRYYERGQEPWEASDDALVTLCEDCHDAETKFRPAAEARLLRTLRGNFSASDVERIADAFNYMTLTRTADVFAAALDWFLIEPENVERICELYLKELSQQRLIDAEVARELAEKREVTESSP